MRLKTDPPAPAEPPAEDDVRFTRWWAELRAGLAETLNGVLLRAARPVFVGQTPVSNPLTKVVSTSAGRLMGWSFRETTNASWVTVEMYDSPTGPVEGELIAITTAPPGLASPPSWPDGGISFQHGLVVVMTPQPNAQGKGVVYLGGPD